MQIFEVYKGIIALFSVSNQQKHAQTETIEPFDIEIFAVTGEIGYHQKFAAAGAVTDRFHFGKGSQKVLAVFFADFFRFRTHATQDFDSGNHIVAIEPVAERIFTATEQNGTMAFLRKNTVEIVYPKCNAATYEKSKGYHQAG